MKIPLAIITVSILALAGCGATRNPPMTSTTKGDALPAPQVPATLILQDKAAEEIYGVTNLSVTQTSDDSEFDTFIYLSKTYTGPVDVLCTDTSGSSSADQWNCSAEVIQPPRATDGPMSEGPFMQIAGQTARAYYAALQVPESVKNGVRRKEFRRDGIYSCTETIDLAKPTAPAPAAPPSFTCLLSQLSDPTPQR